VRAWGQPGTECRTNTTLAKQMADWVILYSPMQMACDLLENYEGHPAFQFFRDYDADCDESQALQGEVGEYIALVRRAGERYFLAATTDTTPRQLQIPLSFLKKGIRYAAEVYADAPGTDWLTEPDQVAISHLGPLTASDTLPVDLPAGGGQVVLFHPE